MLTKIHLLIFFFLRKTLPEAHISDMRRALGVLKLGGKTLKEESTWEI
jgi:hypothetical protein